MCKKMWGRQSKKWGSGAHTNMFNHHEQEICSKLWKVFKEHYNDQTNEQAEEALSEFIRICNKYDSSAFCREMALAMNNQLMLRWNENHPKEANHA